MAIITTTIDKYCTSLCLLVAALLQPPGSTDGRARPSRAHQPVQRRMAHPSQEITVLAGKMGTPLAYVMTRHDYIETGGVGCMVCWRWMHFNNHEGHKAGKKHMKKHQDLMTERPASNQTQSIESKPVLWEIIFARESGREPMLSDDPDMKLEQYRATAGSDGR